MVHNGIEYGDMQLICEAYNLMKDALGMDHDEMAAILADWNKGELDSFLIEISANILKYKDTDGQPLVEKIRDAAGQKGTGKWTAISALEYGMPVTLIGKAFPVHLTEFEYSKWVFRIIINLRIQHRRTKVTFIKVR